MLSLPETLRDLQSKRKFLAARGDLVTKLTEIAHKKNVTLYGLLNELLQQAIRTEEMGRTLEEVVDNQVILALAKEAGFTLAPETLWTDLLDKVFEKESKSMNEMWHDAGQWFGKFCQVRYPGPESFRFLEKTMRTLFWHVSDFTVDSRPDHISVRCVGSRLSRSETALLAEFISGVLGTFGYFLGNRTVSRGIISLEFSKKGE